MLLQLLLFLGISACQEMDQQEMEPLDLETNSNAVELFGEGILSTQLYERDIAISPKGDELVYTLGDYKQQKRCLVALKKSEGKWGKPKILELSGQYQDIEPFYSPDGQSLFFCSNRPTAEGSTRNDYNIWYCKREGDQWRQPQLMSENINTESDEFYPSVSKNGNLYFTSSREGGIGREDIYISKKVDGVYQNAQLLDSTINTNFYEFNAYVNPEENLLLFSSFGRPDGYGGGDLYYSTKDDNGQWKTAKNMGEEINSDKLDYCPFIDVKRNVLYFTSERMEVHPERITSIEELESFSNRPKNGMGDIYRISLNGLEIN